jgi:hypothetical protein
MLLDIKELSMHPFPLVPVTSMIAIFFTAACSSSTNLPVRLEDGDSGLRDAETTSDSAIEIDAGPNLECNAIAQQGSSVSATGSADPAPKPAGGTTVDGTYVLTSVVGYGSAQAIPYKNRSTLEAKGLVVNVVEDTGKGDVRKTGTGTVVDVTLTLTETCAFPKRKLLIERANFTATATEIRLYGSAGGITLVQTFTKQ